MRCLISSSNAFSLSSCLHVSFGIQCHYLWKTFELYYTRLLATFILKSHVYHRSSNCKNIWKLFGVILNTGFDVFLYLRYNTWFLYTRPSGNPVWIFLWTSCDISWFSFVCLRNLYAFFMHFLCSSLHFLCISYAILLHFLCNNLHFLCTSYAFLCSSYAVLKTSYTFAQTAYTFAQNVWSCKNCTRIA